MSTVHVERGWARPPGARMDHYFEGYAGIYISACREWNDDNTPRDLELRPRSDGLGCKRCVRAMGAKGRA